MSEPDIGKFEDLTLCDPVPGTTSPRDLSLRRHVSAIRVDVVPDNVGQSQPSIHCQLFFLQITKGLI